MKDVAEFLGRNPADVDALGEYYVSHVEALKEDLAWVEHEREKREMWRARAMTDPGDPGGKRGV